MLSKLLFYQGMFNAGSVIPLDKVHYSSVCGSMLVIEYSLVLLLFRLQQFRIL